jgi:phosphoribosylformylglycinamidine cyclo-ligase
VKACRENGCALIGGETAEMPGMYAPDEYDIAGTIVGVVEKDLILKKDNVRDGDVLIGLPSTGLHTNGFSLARAVLLPHVDVSSYCGELGCTLGDALLAIHKSYFNEVYPLLQTNVIHAVSHITGGGIIGNTSRVVPKGLSIDVAWDAWPRPHIFQMIQQLGNVPEDDMRRVFNLGIGMILIADRDGASALLADLANIHPIELGTIRKRT